MNVRCPTCDTVYRVDPTKVPAAGTRARCGVCAGIIPVSANGTSTAPAPLAPRASVPSPAPVVAPEPAAPIPPPAAAPKSPTPTRRVTAPFFQPRRTDVAPVPSLAPVPSIAPVTPEIPAPPAAPARPSAPVFTPTPDAPLTRPTAAPEATPAAAAPAQLAAPAGGGFVNPFLAQDPRQKARRLARALVSDMIVYQPGKRQEAMAAGNVKEAFEEEIRKSWEEYVDQIGDEIATSTPYWAEALNEILAGGQQLF